jgi:hypothetical protein
MEAASIPGYGYGSTDTRSPVSGHDFELLRQTVLFSDDDERYLRMAGEVLADQTEQVLDVWYGFVAGHPHLVAYFSTADGQPIGDYLARVRVRFGQWISDLCNRPFDGTWLDYQHEIAVRHTSAKKNQTDGADSVASIPMRYLIAFVYPITATIRGFLENKGHSAADVEAMHQAWFKAVTLSVVLWSQPYAPETW